MMNGYSIDVQSLEPDDFDQVAEILRVLSHRCRLALVLQLMRKRLTVGELSQLLGLPQAGVSQHLSKMKAAGLVHPERDGACVYYRVDHPIARAVLRCILSNGLCINHNERNEES